MVNSSLFFYVLVPL